MPGRHLLVSSTIPFPCIRRRRCWPPGHHAGLFHANPLDCSGLLVAEVALRPAAQHCSGGAVTVELEGQPLARYGGSSGCLSIGAGPAPQRHRRPYSVSSTPAAIPSSDENLLRGLSPRTEPEVPTPHHLLPHRRGRVSSQPSAHAASRSAAMA